jgi:hypothetical protein
VEEDQVWHTNNQRREGKEVRYKGKRKLIGKLAKIFLKSDF